MIKFSLFGMSFFFLQKLNAHLALDLAVLTPDIPEESSKVLPNLILSHHFELKCPWNHNSLISTSYVEIGFDDIDRCVYILYYI